MTRYITMTVITINLFACGQSVGTHTLAPQSTWTMRFEWGRAETELWACWDQVEEQDEWCRENPQPNADCTTEQQLGDRRCYYYFASNVNKLPIRECGASVFIITGMPEDIDFAVEQNQADSDGDGLSNYWEARMGYNPCHEYSFGTQYPMDGEDDFDADGVLDRDDNSPICNGSFMPGGQSYLPDPANYGADCI